MQSIPPQKIAPQIVGQMATHLGGTNPNMLVIQNTTNSSATAGMVLGIVSMVLTVLSPLSLFVCCFISIPLAFFGMIFSHIGHKNSKITGVGKGQAVTGLILNWLQLLMVFIPMAGIVFNENLYWI